MEDKGKKSDRDNATGTKTSEGDPVPFDSQGSKDTNGDPGTPGKMESVVEGKPQEKLSKDEILLLTANNFRDQAISMFNQLAFQKYNAGQKEHGGFLVDTCSIFDLDAEIIDLWFYVQAMKAKLWAVLPEDQRGMFFRDRSQQAPDMESNNS